MHAWPDGSSYGVGAVNYGPPHGGDGWSMSDGTPPFAFVRSRGIKQSRLCGRRFADGRC